jgi:hypothetical protein
MLRKEKINPKNLPILVYEDGEYDSEDVFKKAFRGPLVIEVRQA